MAPFVEPTDEGSGGEFRVSIGDVADGIEGRLRCSTMGMQRLARERGRSPLPAKALGLKKRSSAVRRPLRRQRTRESMVEPHSMATSG